MRNLSADYPINMDDFHLFDENHRSSYPLCIAYKAAQLVEPQKADDYLRQLRRATIVETRQTTRIDELIAAAISVGFDKNLFMRFWEDGSAEKAFQEDLKLTRSLGIHSLPTCLIECNKNTALVSGMNNYEAFVTIIEKIKSNS